MRMRPSWLAWGPPAVLLLLAACSIYAYKPVIIIHGILDGPKELETLSAFIKTVHPGTQVAVISLYNYAESMMSLWKQVSDFRRAVQDIMATSPDGVHLLCYSQGALLTFLSPQALPKDASTDEGGLICRALLSTAPEHNVDTFISLSAPLAGQYGDTDYLKPLLPEPVKKELHLFCYNTDGQKFSFCDYWNDPHHRRSYLSRNTFLPLLNGETPHRDLTAWRENFLRVKRLVLIGGPDDGVITPWQSSHFGFYDAEENMVGMREQEFYRNDAFGLQTLEARGAVSLCVESGVEHAQWRSNVTVFQRCVESFLT